jgi:hypothetical protein
LIRKVADPAVRETTPYFALLGRTQMTRHARAAAYVP